MRNLFCKLYNKAMYKVYTYKNKLQLIKFIGIKKGDKLQVYGNTKIFGDSCNIIIGSNCSLNEGVILSANSQILIGDNVTISSYSVLHTGYLDINGFPVKSHIYKPIIIGKNVWIASHCIIGGGVKIGDNIIIGANSFVNKDLESGYFYAGTPVKKIRKLN